MQMQFKDHRAKYNKTKQKHAYLAVCNLPLIRKKFAT